MMPNQDVQNKAVRPTLFLGLGGTGKEVLLRLRRKFYERLGVTGLPCTSYLWLDTDTSDKDAKGEPMSDIFSAVAFKPEEQIALLTGNVGGDLADVFKNRQHWQHIHSWLHPQVEQYGAEIADGAGGVRAVGRLTYFFHFAQTVNPRLSGALQGVGSFHAINDTQTFFHNRGLGAPDFLPQPTPQVFLVTSLAGGTGCGTFLDVLFHLRNLSQNGGVPIERIVAILFMPNVFYANAADEVARRSYANAYAALKELEYYTLRVADPAKELSIDFDVEWEPGKPRSIQGPPFAIANILEARNEDTILLQPSNRSELFSVVAESLFLDFIPGPFPDAKRSAYSNVSQYLAGHEGANASTENVELPQNFARRYASFGMSKIEIPIDPIKGACAARLGEEIATYINRAGHDTQVQDSVRGDMAQRKFDGEGILGRFNDGYKGNIRTRIASVANQAILKTPADVDRLGGALESEVRALAASDGTDPARWGSAVSAIRGETGDVTGRLNKDVLEWIKTSLEDDVRGLKSLIKKEGYLYFLTRYMEDLYSPPGPNQAAYYDARLAKAKQDQEFWRKERQKALAELKMAVGSVGLKLLLRTEWVVDTLKDRLRNATEQFCLAGADDCLLREAKDVAAKGVDFANQQRPRLQKMADAVEATIVDFRGKCKDLLNVSQQVLLIRFFDQQEDWPKFYTLAGASVSPRVEYGRFLTQIPLDPGQPPVRLWDLAKEISREGATALIRKLHDYAEPRFWRDFDAHPRDADVLTHPEMAGKWQMKIDSLVRNAMPLARRGATMVGKALQVRRMAFLGVAALTGEPYAKFIQEIRTKLTARGFANHDIIVQDTGKPWEVYLYVVTYAFPLPALTVVTSDCQDAYNEFYRDLVENRVQQQRHQIPLHISSRWEGKFDDLVVYTDRAAKEVREAREVLLFGPVFGVLGASLDRGRVLFNHWGLPPLKPLMSLGAKREAIEWLRANQEKRQEFLTRIRERDAALAPDDLKVYYWLLYSLVKTGEYLPGSPELTLLERRLTDLYACLSQRGVAEAELSADAAPAGDVVAFARGRAGGRVDWTGPVPKFRPIEKKETQEPAGA
jgi:hypothetical protein